MKNLVSAIQFLTIIPAGKTGSFNPDKMVPFFPIVGITIGVLLALFDIIAGALWSRPVTALLDVVFLAVITGAFHIDGLGDTADGLFSHRPREKVLAIMKDSRIGVMGLITIICAFSVKWAGISGLEYGKSAFFIAIPSLARGGMLFGMALLPYGRPEGGTASAFFGNGLSKKDFWGCVPALAILLCVGWKGVFLCLFWILTVFTILFYYRKKLGCITGDMLGALSETSETLLFLAASIGGIS